MTAPNQIPIPELPEAHVKKEPGCQLCGAELPPREPGKAGRPQSYCLTPKHGERASCFDIKEAIKRIEAVMPPDRARLRKLKQRRLKRRSRAFTEAEQAEFTAMVQEIGPEYPLKVRRAIRSKLLKLANRLNSDGKGNA